MYRIFRGKHLLILTDQEADLKAFDPDFIFRKPSDEQILEILRLSKGSTKALVIGLVGKAKKLLKRISKEFKVIEAAGGMAFNAEGKLLAIKRQGKWDLPKGKLKKGEDIEVCAIREVEEETGARGLTIRSHFIDTYHTYYRGGQWILKKTYWYLMDCADGSELIPQQEEDIEKAKWIKFEKFNRPDRDTYPAIKWILEEYAATLVL